MNNIYNKIRSILWGAASVSVGLILLDKGNRYYLKYVIGNELLELAVLLINIIIATYISTCVWRQGKKDFDL